MNDSFETTQITALVFCRLGYFDHEISKVTDIIKENKRFNTVEQYFYHIINNIKDNVIKKFENLKLIKIQLSIFDKDNIWHRLIISVSKLLVDFLKLKNNIDFSKSIFVCVEYNNKPVFMANVGV